MRIVTRRDMPAMRPRRGRAGKRRYDVVAMTSWNPKLSRGPGPTYRNVADAIGRDVDAGRLERGDRLPTQRDLARPMGVALATVSRGYDEAAWRGLIVCEVGRGSF